MPGCGGFWLRSAYILLMGLMLWSWAMPMAMAKDEDKPAFNVRERWVELKDEPQPPMLGSPRGALGGQPGVVLSNRMPNRQWWLDFNDPYLTHYIQTAIQNNPSLQAAFARIAQARAQVKQAIANQLPTLSTGLFIGRFIVPRNLRNNGFLNDHIDIFTVPFTVAYEFDLWGKYWDMTKSARKEVKAQEADSKASEVLLAAEVATAYFKMILAEELYNYSQNYVVRQQESRALTESLYQSGLASLDAVLQIDREITQTETYLHQYQAQKGIYAHQLATLAGEEPKVFDEMPRTPLAQIQLPEQLDAGMPLTAIFQRPDIQAQEARLQRSRIDVRVARKMFLPTARVSDYFGWGSDRIGNLSGDGFYNLLLGSANQPLFQGGKILGNLRLRQAQLREQLETYRQKVLTALKEVEDSLSDLRRRIDDAGSANHTVSLERSTLELTRSQYQSGLNSRIDVIKAENDLLYDQALAMQIKAATAQAMINLYKALGGGY